ncbi:CPC_1213 family protein [Clostridium hydrogenum]|nr:CPC_1213 family protein [Clostridium hydrogenum]
MDKNNKKPDHVKKSNKKNIKHDPSAESARAKFSPKNEEKDLS